MSHPDSNVAQFARARNADSDTVGLKLELCTRTVMWLDAEALARGDKFRGPLICEILDAWADEQEHRHMMRSRVVRGNSVASESGIAGEVLRAAEARAGEPVRA